MEIQTQSTSCFHRLQSFTAQKHHRAQDAADPGNSRIAAPFLKLFLKCRSFVWDSACSYCNAVIILNLIVSLPSPVSAGNKALILRCHTKSYVLFPVFWWEIENSRNFSSEPVFLRFLACFFFFYKKVILSFVKLPSLLRGGQWSTTLNHQVFYPLFFLLKFCGTIPAYFSRHPNASSIYMCHEEELNQVLHGKVISEIKEASK